MMKVVLLLLALVFLASAHKWNRLGLHEKHKYTFENFKSEFTPEYKDAAEEAMRREIFEKKLRTVHHHNMDRTKTWKKAVNKFSDRTDEEFKSFLGLNAPLLYQQKASKKQVSNVVVHHATDADVEYLKGTNVDWRSKGIITDPKDQASCGSCWTFSTAETVESYYALKSGHLLTLSEQQILDCTPNPNKCGGTGGCEGGTVELAVARIVQMGGLTNESDYPYVSGDGSDFTCDMSKFKPAVQVKKFVNLPSNQAAPILKHVATVGPLSISVDASSWSDYGGGVFDGCNNQSPDIDHAVQLVGFGTDPDNGDYWLVRNSWGPDYGENGYIRLKRYSTPPCGVDSTPADGDGCSGGPSQVTVCGNCGILFDTVYVEM